jgi:hypothetical protein
VIARRGKTAPPPSLDHTNDAEHANTPPTYVYVERREPRANTESYWATPDDNQGAATPVYADASGLGISTYQKAPDPVIERSPFYANGNKVNPWAHRIKPSHVRLTMGKWVTDNFQAGKMTHPHLVPTYAGGQLPWDEKYNIQPGQSTTYGSQYTVVPYGMDGDPYS